MKNEQRSNAAEDTKRPVEDIVKKAIRFAGLKHEGQKRKFTGQPYIFHPFRVSQILVQVTGDHATLAAGLLHDTLEDTETTFPELVKEFGREVAHLVNAVTEQDRSLGWEPRKLAAIEHLKEGSQKSWLIKAADMIDNITSLNGLLQKYGTHSDVLKCFNAPLSQQLKMALKTYRTLQELWSNNPLLEKLMAAIQELAHFFYKEVHGDTQAEPTPEKYSIDMEFEINRFFDPISKPAKENPKCVILMGGTGAGKTSLKNMKYAASCVSVDIGTIFLNLSRGKMYKFGEAFEREMQTISSEVTHKAISERRDMVMEIIGESAEDAKRLIDALGTVGYKIELVYVDCDVDEAYIRHIIGSVENVSASLTQSYLRECVLAAVQRYRSETESARLIS